METLIIYHSKYGHTKKYAQWLAEALSADICESGNLSFLHKTMMKIVYSQLSKKPDSELTDENRDLLATYGQNIDFSEKEMLEPMIQYCKSR